MSEKEKKVNIHNSSVFMARSEDKVQSTVSRANKLNKIISSLPLDWLVYEELSRLYYSVQIRSVSVLTPTAVALVGGSCLSYDHSSLRLKSNRDRKGVFIYFIICLKDLMNFFTTRYCRGLAGITRQIDLRSLFNVFKNEGF